MLQILFQQYPGFKEVRMIEAKPGIAFVEFEDDMQASIAMQALQGFKITPQNPMAIVYAKKWYKFPADSRVHSELLSLEMLFVIVCMRTTWSYEKGGKMMINPELIDSLSAFKALLWRWIRIVSMWYFSAFCLLWRVNILVGSSSCEL